MKEDSQNPLDIVGDFQAYASHNESSESHKPEPIQVQSARIGCIHRDQREEEKTIQVMDLGIQNI